MEYLSKKTVAIGLVLAVLILPAVSHGQLGGIVYDPTNYANAVLRYNQLVQRLARLRQTYQQVLKPVQPRTPNVEKSQEHASPISRNVLPMAKLHSE